METIIVMAEILWIMKWHVAMGAGVCFVAYKTAQKVEVL